MSDSKVKPYPNNIKERIRFYGYKVREVSIGIDIPRSTISDYLAGNRPAPHECLQKIADFIGCDVKEFVYQQMTVSTQVETEGLLDTVALSLHPTYHPSRRDKLPILFTVNQAISLDTTSGDCAMWFSERLAQIIAFVTKWQKRMSASDFQKILDRELRVFDEIKTMFDPDTYFLSRRSALLVIAALPKGLLGLLQQQKTALIEEDFLPACAASITACWHLLNGREFVSVEQTLSRYLPFLVGWARQASPYRRTAAYLASQGCLLLSLVASHRLWLQQRATYCEEAVELAKDAEDRILQIKALSMLGNALYDQKAYDEMLRTYQDARHGINEAVSKIPQVLQCKVLMGLAHAYAQHGRVQEALNTVSEARAIFPGDVEELPPFLSADDGLFSLILFEGWVRLDLGKREPDKEHYDHAAKVLAQIEELPRTILVPERIRIEITNRRAQAAIAQGNLDAFLHYTLQSAESLKQVTSEKRRQELVVNYKAARKKWSHESQVLELADALL